MEYLQLHQGRWRYRRRWPKDVLKLSDSGSNFIKTLGTSDKSEAKRRRATVELEFNAKVTSLRRRLDELPRELSVEEAVSLAGQWYRDAYNEMESDVRSVRLTEYQREERKELFARYGEDGGPFDYGDFDSAKEAALKILADAGVSALSSGDGFNTLVNLVESGVFELARQGNLLGLQQDYSGPDDRVLRTAIEGQSSGKPIRTLGDLIEAHRADKEGSWSKSTSDSYKPVHRLLSDVLGITRALESIDRDAAREVFGYIQSLPKNIGKRKDMKGLAVSEAVEKGKLLGLPTISAKTINGTYLSGIKAMFEWAEAEDWIDKNPFRKISVTDPVPDAERRDPFTLSQLQKLFGSTPWRPRDDSPLGKPAYYWVPLLSLFHGLRLGEASGLMLDDITEAEGCPVMLVRPSIVRGLKTEQSRRTIPMHPQIIDLGFLDYVETQRQPGQEKLFPDALAKERGQVGYNVSRWFSAQVKALGLQGHNLAFHSLRHNFEDRLREAELHGTAIGQYLGGRSSGGVSASYGAGFSTVKLREAIGRLEYPGLEF